MIQLTFQPAFDPFHAVFRLLRLMPIIGSRGPLNRDLVRILDFYLLFPFRIDSIRLTQQHRKYKKLASEYQTIKPYGDQPEDVIIFNRMESMQLAALETLGAQNLIVPNRLVIGLVEATSTPIPEEVASRVDAANEQNVELLAFLSILASEYDLTGADGLKARTNLLEYRYDAV